MPTFKVAGRVLELDPERVERAVAGVLPEPVHEHYVVIGGRRFPPKQVLCHLAPLDRADFTTHQARRILKRLGFLASRHSTDPRDGESEPAAGVGPYGGRQAAMLDRYRGMWVALAGPLDVLVAANTPQEILAWLAKHDKRATFGMFRVPDSRAEAEGASPA